VCCNHNGRPGSDNYYYLYPLESVALKAVHLSGDHCKAYTSQSIRRKCTWYYLYLLSSVM
jgi:hypothetical protein